jgi:hypothetical protein
MARKHEKPDVVFDGEHIQILKSYSPEDDGETFLIKELKNAPPTNHSLILNVSEVTELALGLSQAAQSAQSWSLSKRPLPDS